MPGPLSLPGRFIDRSTRYPRGGHPWGDRPHLRCQKGPDTPKHGQATHTPASGVSKGQSLENRALAAALGLSALASYRPRYVKGGGKPAGEVAGRL